MNLALTGWMARIGLGWSAVLGALLGLFLPRLTIPSYDRSWADSVCGAVTGAAIAATIWSCLIAFSAWRYLRSRDGRLGPARVYLALVLFAVVHFLVVLAICKTLTEVIAQE